MTELNPSPTATRSALLPSTIRRVVLIGFMGAGKTSVGRLLAAELGWAFLDLDAHLEARAGRSVPAIFAADGEEVFRRLETGALANALGTTETVLALGGGTPEHLGNCLLLEQTPGTLIVHLDAPFETLYDRCMMQELSARPARSQPEPARCMMQELSARPALSQPEPARGMMQELSARPLEHESEAQWSRPVLSSPADAAERYRRRQPIYQRLADVSVSTGEESAASTLRRLLETFCRM